MKKLQLLRSIRDELEQNKELVYKNGVTRYLKEDVNPIGVRMPKVRRIAKKYFPKDLNKKEIFELCEQLLEKRTMEETFIAFAWVRRIEDNLVITDFARLERWLKKYVDNWAFCDDFCTHAFGSFILQFPSLIPRVKKWTKSKNRWLRRASAVIFIHAIKKKAYLKHIFEIADILLLDRDDLVQKGYGWALKEASNKYPAKVFAFVMKRKKQMPRTALRYAIEKYPQEMRKEAMKK